MKLTTKIFALFLMFTSEVSLACIADPQVLLAQDPVVQFEQSELVFLGKIEKFDDFRDWEQIVTLSVDTTFKGPSFEKITIVNKLNSSCAAVFRYLGSSYYVFARFDTETQHYITEHASFAPLCLALKHQMELPGAHNKRMQTDKTLATRVLCR